MRPSTRTTGSCASSRGSSAARPPSRGSRGTTGPARAAPAGPARERGAAEAARGRGSRTSRWSLRSRAPRRGSRSRRSPATRESVRAVWRSVLAEDVEMRAQGVRDDVARRTPRRARAARALRRAAVQRAREDREHRSAVLRPEGRGVEAQQQPVERRHAFCGANPLARASRTRPARRLVSARATAWPNGVMR